MGLGRTAWRDCLGITWWTGEGLNVAISSSQAFKHTRLFFLGTCRGQTRVRSTMMAVMVMSGPGSMVIGKREVGGEGGKLQGWWSTMGAAMQLATD